MTSFNKANFPYIILLFLIFIRPFISARAFFFANSYYQTALFSLFFFSLVFKNKFILPRASLNRPILILLLASGLSLHFSAITNSTILGLQTILSFIIIFYLIVQLNNVRSAKCVIYTMIIAATLLSIYGINQYIFAFNHTLEYIDSIAGNLPNYQYAKQTLESKRIFATFFSPDMFAGYLIIIIPLTGGVLIERLQKRKKPILLGFALISMFVALILTKSLGALLCFGLSMSLFFILLIKTFRWQKIYPFFLIFLFITVLISSVLFVKRADWFLDLNNPNNSIIQRLNYWISAVKIIKEFPIRGVGIGNFGKVYSEYMMQGANQTNFTHNSYLQIWAESGILGIGAFLWISFTFLKNGFRKLRCLETNGLQIGLISAGVAFLSHNFIDYDFFIPEVAFHWWIILGILESSIFSKEIQ